jgi:hypothetical protein
MKWIIAIVVLLNITSAFSCEISAKIRQLNGLDFQTLPIYEHAQTSFATKNYAIVSQTNPKMNVLLTLSKGRDPLEPNELVAKVSIALYKNGRLENYTLGVGKNHTNPVHAYSQDNYLLALSNAVGHLPLCE